MTDRLYTQADLDAAVLAALDLVKLHYADVEGGGSTMAGVAKGPPAALTQMGDCKLIWVNEGDLAMLAIERRALAIRERTKP